MTREMTLAIDCGGGGIKGSVVDERGTMMAPPRRVPTPYPLPPELLVETVIGLARELPTATRVTMGMPGMIRHGVVIATPHYITRDGPRSRVLPELVERWDHFDMGRAIEQALGLPTKVLNDAEVAGAGAITGRGLEMIITLGTGLGNAVFDGGQLAPHVEVSQGPVRWGLTYDDYIGEHERLRLGDVHWSRRIRRVVDGLRPMYMWDRLYLGGGNSKRITASNLRLMGDDVIAHEPQVRGSDALGVTATQVEAVPHVHGAQAIHDAADAARPVHVAQAQALVLADVVVVGQAPANRSLRDLDVGCQLAAVKHRVAQARAQSDDHFETASRDRASASDFGVVQDLGGQAEGLLDRTAHVKVVPPLHELGQHTRARSVAGDVVRGCDDDAVADHARHTHRHSRCRGKLTREADDGFHEKLGR